MSHSNDRNNPIKISDAKELTGDNTETFTCSNKVDLYRNDDSIFAEEKLKGGNDSQDNFKHFLFADTDFVRRPGLPIFVMASTEHFRRLRFPPYFSCLPFEVRLETACQKARDHMQECGGQLVTWGEIKRYHYCFADKRSIVISTTGKVIGENNNFDPPMATCKVQDTNENLPDLLRTNKDQT